MSATQLELAFTCVSPPIGCGREIRPVEFYEWDEPTLREYQISGWCDNCQEVVFEDAEEEDGWTGRFREEGDE